MRILIAMPDEGESAQLTTVLKKGGHEVRSAREEQAIAATLAEQSPHLVLFGTHGPSDPLLAMLRSTSAAPSRPHVLCIHSGLADDYVAQILDAGADGEMKRPLAGRYFLARLGAIQRRMDPPKAAPKEQPAVDWSGFVASDDGPVARPSRGVSPIEVVSRSGVWTHVLDHLEGAASRFLTMSVSASELPANFEPEGLGASIVLLSAATQLELRISVAMNVKSAEGLVVHLFGSGGEGMAQEVLNELVNILMGSLKTMFIGESFAFTGGLPEITPVESVLRPAMPYRFQESALLSAGDARLVLFVGLRSRANILLAPGVLREGMVLAKDVLNARGMLLLNGGTRLTGHMVERLKSNLTPKHEIEVIAP